MLYQASPEAAWAIFLLPLLSFIIIAFFIRPFLNNKPELSGYVTFVTLGISFLLSIWVLLTVYHNGPIDVADIGWVAIGNTQLHVGLIIDELTAVMLLVVTLVSLMVQKHKIKNSAAWKISRSVTTAIAEPIVITAKIQKAISNAIF